MSEPALKCENYAIFKQNYTQKLFISFKISYYCCFGLRGNLEFPDFLQKKFYNINYCSQTIDFINYRPDSAGCMSSGTKKGSASLRPPRS